MAGELVAIAVFLLIAVAGLVLLFAPWALGVVVAIRWALERFGGLDRSAPATPVAAPAPAGAAPARPATLPDATPSARPSFLDNWTAPDSITLLLYLGAALVLLAVGIFVGSAWDAIGGPARWGIVTFLTLAFLAGGEAMTGRKVLRRAGETFRAISLLLLPLVLIAFDRFILEGEGSLLFWSAGFGLLALFYYLFRALTSADRLPLFLGSLSLGIVLLLLPETLGLPEAWRAVALMGAAAAMILVARQAMEGPTGQPHLLTGVLLWLAALALLIDTAPDGAPLTLFLLIQSGLLLLLTLRERHPVLLGLTPFSVGPTIAAAIFWLVPEERELWALVGGWNALALLLAWLAPAADQRVARGGAILRGMTIFWSVAAFSAIGEGDGGAWMAAAAAGTLTLLLGVDALRYRWSIPLGAALLTLHITVLATLNALFEGGGSIVGPTLLWGAFAFLWLWLVPQVPGWATRVAQGAIVFETLFMLFFVTVQPQALAFVVAGVILAGVWLLWAWRDESMWRGAVALAFVWYASIALLNWVTPPPLLYPAAALVLGALLLFGSDELPDWARLPALGAGALLLIVAPQADLTRLALTPDMTLEAAGVLGERMRQVALGIAALVALARGGTARQPFFVALAGALGYVLYAWLLDDASVGETQAYVVPLALLLAGYALLFPRWRRVWEGLAITVLLVPTTLELALDATLLRSLVLAAWGLVLVGVGITLDRPTPRLAGSAAVVIAPLPQLWIVANILPPGVVIGTVGLGLLALAIWLLMRRQRVRAGG